MTQDEIDKLPDLYHLLVLPPQDKPVYFVVKTKQYSGTEARDFDGWQFFFEEHSCPVNWFEPVHIEIEGNDDPHGIIRYLGTKHESELPEYEGRTPSDHNDALNAWIASCGLAAK